MESLKPPKPMSFEGNISENWKSFRQRFELFMKATGADSKEGDVKVAILLHVLGEEAIEKFNTFNLSPDQCKEYATVLGAFQNYCVPKSNESVERHIFFSRVQKDGETYDSFLTDLKKLSASCGFGEMRDSLIKDRVISGILNKGLKDRLLREVDLTLDKCVRMCKSAELATEQLKTLEDDRQVHGVTRKPDQVKKQQVPYENRKYNEGGRNSNPTRQQHSNKGAPGHSRQRDKTSSNNQEVHNSERYNSRPCQRCGRHHPPKQCPAFNKYCGICKFKGHFARMCKNKKTIDVVNEVETPTNTLFCGRIKNEQENVKDWFTEILIEKIKWVQMKMDSGAQCNVIPWNKYKMWHITAPILKTNVKLSNYNGSKIKVVGTCKIECMTRKGCIDSLEFQVVNCEKNAPAVLGLKTLRELDLIKRIDTIVNQSKIIKENNDLFTGLGEIKDFVYDIKLIKNAQPVIEPARKVPINLQDKFKNELQNMIKMGVIKEITEPTEWVNSVVLVNKSDGTIRVCLDPRHLNKNLMREHYPLPTFDEISSKLADSKIFSILDASQAFWQVKLSEQSAKYTTFNTLFGRYCFLRMPYGISSAPEVFHKYFSKIFEGIKGIATYIDDLLIFAKNKNDHEIILKQVLERARKFGIKFNLKKSKIGVDEVTYIGHRFTTEGIKPDNNKIKAILEMAKPKNVKSLMSFLGMITYVAKFIPNVSELTAKLRQLVKKDTVWNWGHEHDLAFEKLKNFLTSVPVLQYFNPSRPITLSVDASKDGLGAVMLQNNLPIAYASKALNETQKQYAQIEKEALAIVFACEKYHEYIYGKKFIVESDHKPLEAIFKKALYDCPARLQRMRMRLLQYDLTIVYKPGRELLIADALSRSFINDETCILEEEINAQIGAITENLNMTSNQKQKFQIETKNDSTLQEVIKLVNDGWPENSDKINELAKEYITFRDSLYLVDNLLFKNNCLVVPSKMKKEMLDRIHFNHMGIEKCKLRARECIFWPGITKDIINLVTNCEACAKFQKLNRKEPMLARNIPTFPWQVLGTDLMYLNGNNYLVIIDYFSKFVEISLLKNITSETVITALKSCFAKFGIPHILNSDNGTQYSGQKFKEFAKALNFTHITSSPMYPKSNGMVERCIGTLKLMLKKAIFDQKDPYLALLEYRNTPLTADIKSPAELMFGRKIVGLLPQKDFLSVNKTYTEPRKHLIKRQQIQKKYYDRGTVKSKQLEINDEVYVQKPDNSKERGKIISKNERPRSFNVQLQSGYQVERNVTHLYKFKPEKEFQINDPISDTEINDETKTNELESKVEVNEPITNDIYNRPKRTRNKPMYLKDYVCK